MFILLLIIAFIVIVSRQQQQKKQTIISSVTTPTRGERSEQDLIYRLVQSGIPPKTIFHDIYIPTKGGYTQIDLVVPTNVGVFVFEVKDYSGWIFGNGKSEKWTQILAYGQEKHQFYNPIKQNEGHIEALRNSLSQLQAIPFFSVIVFYGTSEIKELSNVPKNCRVVYPGQVGKLITDTLANLSPAPYTDKWEVMHLLQTAQKNGTNPEIVNSHLQRAQMASKGKYRSTYNYTPKFVRVNRRYRRL